MAFERTRSLSEVHRASSRQDGRRRGRSMALREGEKMVEDEVRRGLRGEPAPESALVFE